MTTAVPAPPAATEPLSGASRRPRRPRKVFLLVGVVVAVALGVGLFTSVGTSSKGSGQPGPGDPVPAFSAQNVGPTGPPTVSVSPEQQRPTVLLFFGSWCTACKSELPPLAKAVQRQEEAHGSLSAIRVVGVDTLDSPATAESFVHEEGVTFPVAADADGAITAGKFEFQGDPYTVFVDADGAIAKVVPGDQLTPASFTADERALIPSGR
ncbi:MAG TPA: TlpA disulfide reductase family protein [Acidimicrobiales bacterium]|nr:TlpA disulfide reductase family protein [Acidimicrobiales bacterium]